MDIPTPQMRARIICTMCHKRKVRCDLEHSRDNVCSNCRRLQQPCIRRRGRRSKAGGFAPVAADIVRSDASESSNAPVMVSPAELLGHLQGSEEPANEAPGRLSFIASDSVLYDGIPSSRPEASALDDGRTTEAFLRSLPPITDPIQGPLRVALLDSFADVFHHWYPFVDIARFRHSTAPLLENTLLLAGSLVRRIETVQDLRLPYSLYQKAKERIYSHDGGDPITLLKAMTIMACWSLRSPSIISLDGPWHWGGLAMRLALQMGMHQESTYARLEDSDNCRLMWWHLMNSDVLQAACWGRPCLIQSQHQNVQPPQLSDTSSDTLHIFVQSNRLLIVLRQVIETGTGSLTETVVSLVNWYQKVPLRLHLHDTAGYRNTYNKPVSELFILYFAVIIFLSFRHEMADGDGHRARVSPITIAASSCMIRLYEEIYHHDDSARLGSVHGFFLMLAAVPQIFHRTSSVDKERLREREIEHIYTTLHQLRLKYGGCNMVLHKISRLRTDSHNERQQQDLTPDAQGLFRETMTGGVTQYSHQLFPFPISFAPNLDLLGEDLLQSGTDSYQQDASIIDMLAFESSLFDWSLDGFTELQPMS